MIKRCIMIFPKFENEEVIEKIRKKYDPLAKHVRPHITLVFPFDSEIKTIELKEHIVRILSQSQPFELVLNQVTPNDTFGKYLFLNIQKGRHEIIELHKKLYTGILQRFFPDWLKEEKFLPHMTVGCFENEKNFKIAIEETQDIDEVFKTIVNAISVEVIADNEDSIIELNIPIK